MLIKNINPYKVVCGTNFMPTAIEKLDFRVNQEWADCARENPWLDFVPAFAKDSKGQEFMRGVGRSVAYKIKTEDAKGKQTYECGQCGGEVMATNVAHPILDSPICCSGSGRVRNEQVPYCPKCETRPRGSGEPIIL